MIKTNVFARFTIVINSQHRHEPQNMFMCNDHHHHRHEKCFEQCIEHHNMFMLVSATPCLPCPSVLTLLPEPQHDFTQQDDFEEDKFDCLLIIAHVAGIGVKKNSSMVGLWILFIRQRVLS